MDWIRQRRKGPFLNQRGMRSQISSPRLILTLFTIASLLFVGCIFGMWKAYSMPETIDQEMLVVNYQHEGKFDYPLYVTPGHLFGNPPETPQNQEESKTYFTHIIDDI